VARRADRGKGPGRKGGFSFQLRVRRASPPSCEETPYTLGDRASLVQEALDLLGGG